MNVWEFAIARKASQLLSAAEERELTPIEDRTLDACLPLMDLLEIREGRREVSRRVTAR